MEVTQYSLSKKGIGQRTTLEVDGVLVVDSRTDNFDEKNVITNEQAAEHFAKLQEESDAVTAKFVKEAFEAGEKKAQEAYDEAVKAGLPEIVAVGIARNYSPGFEVKKDVVAEK